MEEPMVTAAAVKPWTYEPKKEAANLAKAPRTAVAVMMAALLWS
jgi:hypothetical protein